MFINHVGNQINYIMLSLSFKGTCKVLYYKKKKKKKKLVELHFKIIIREHGETHVYICK